MYTILYIIITEDIHAFKYFRLCTAVSHTSRLGGRTMKKKLIFSLVLALAVCLALIPCAFAESAETPGPQSGYAEHIPDETLSNVLPENEQEETDGPSFTVTGDEEKQSEELPSGEDEQVPADEESSEDKDAVAADFEETRNDAENGSGAPDASFSATFHGTDGIEYEVAGGTYVDVSELLEALGYSGEITSVTSSNENVLSVSEGRIFIRDTFYEESITAVVDGVEITIPVFDDISITSYGDLVSEIVKNNSAKLVLYHDLFSSDTSKPLVVAGTKILDLNGHILEHSNLYSLFTMHEGSRLTIIDSNPNSVHSGGYPNGGVIALAYQNSSSYYIFQNSNDNGAAADLTIDGGTFCRKPGTNTNNFYVVNQTYTNSFNLTIKSGTLNGAVDIGPTGHVEMTGGKICNNPGAFAVRAKCEFVMSGGEISGNTTSGYIATFTKLKMSGTAAIKNNSCSYINGIDIEHLVMTGGEITGNTTTQDTRVYSSGTVTLTKSCNLSGNAKVNGNKLLVSGKSIDSNLLLGRYANIDFDSQSGTFTEGANIGITTPKKPTPGNGVLFTKNFKDNNATKNLEDVFFSDEGYTTVLCDNKNDGQLMAATVKVTDLSGGTTYYTSLKDAYNASVSDGYVITLLANTAVDDGTTLKIERAVTIVTNGKTINTGSGTLEIEMAA